MTWLYPSEKKNFSSPFSVQETLKNLEAGFRPLTFWNIFKDIFINGWPTVKPLTFIGMKKNSITVFTFVWGLNPWSLVSNFFSFLKPAYHGEVITHGDKTEIHGEFRFITSTKVIHLIALAALVYWSAKMAYLIYMHQPSLLFEENHVLAWWLPLICAAILMVVPHYSFQRVNYFRDFIINEIEATLKANPCSD
jgi:hypothetical protein